MAVRRDGDRTGATAARERANIAVRRARTAPTALIKKPAEALPGGGRRVGDRYGADVARADRRLVGDARPVHVSVVIDHDGRSDLIGHGCLLAPDGPGFL